jgi:hypothetical protein
MKTNPLLPDKWSDRLEQFHHWILRDPLFHLMLIGFFGGLAALVATLLIYLAWTVLFIIFTTAFWH